MKTIILFTIIFCLSHLAIAQNQIDVCENKTTHLIANEKVSYVQVGDFEKIIAEIVPEHPNMVRVKATESFEGESSLTIVSANRAYALFVKYSDTNKITYQLNNFYSEKVGDIQSGALPEYLLKELSSQILHKRQQKVKSIKTEKDKINFQLRNIYLKNDVLFFELQITNKSNIAYDVEGFNWWIDDKKEFKATNVQEYQVEPEYQHYRIKTIPANTTVRIVFVLPKLTIPDKRALRIEMLESALGNTGRKLSLEIKNRHIINAKSL